MAEAAPKIRMIVGPTASGKTGRAIEMALATDGEVVSADSRCLYRGLDIGTAKPSREEQAGVPHHLIDVLDLGEVCSAGQFASRAETAISDILERGRTPIVAGGSTLYLDALVRGLASIPPVPADVRSRLTERLASEGLPALVRELTEADPVLAARLDLANPMRVMRGLEVFEATGTPLSTWQLRRTTPRYSYEIELLDPPREVLHERINHRVVEMVAAGWLGEVKGLLAAGHSPALEPLRTIGYREMAEVALGTLTLDEAVPLIQQRTRQYARRQRTYFRHQFFDGQ